MKIISFDFDYTMSVEISGIEFISQKLGFINEIRNLEKLFQEGKINTDDFSNHTAAFFKGIKLEYIYDVAKHIPILANMGESIYLLQKMGYIVIINTLTYDFIIRPFKDIFNIPFVTGVTMSCDKNNILTGEITRYFRPEDKVSSLKKWASKNKKGIRKLIAIGDSLGDKPIFEIADYKIALNSFSSELISISNVNLLTHNALDIVKHIISTQ